VGLEGGGEGGGGNGGEVVGGSRYISTVEFYIQGCGERKGDGRHMNWASG